jgi:hypothetical protein
MSAKNALGYVFEHQIHDGPAAPRTRKCLSPYVLKRGARTSDIFYCQRGANHGGKHVCFEHEWPNLDGVIDDDSSANPAS